MPLSSLLLVVIIYYSDMIFQNVKVLVLQALEKDLGKKGRKGGKKGAKKDKGKGKGKGKKEKDLTPNRYFLLLKLLKFCNFICKLYKNFIL